MEYRKGYKTNITVPLREKITDGFRRAPKYGVSYLHDKGTASFDPARGEEQYFPHRTRLDEYACTETIYDATLVQEVTDKILAIRQQALSAPSQIRPDGGSITGIPFEVYDVTEYSQADSRRDILPAQHTPETGVVRVVHRPGGRIEHITFASNLQGREIITTIAVEVEGAADSGEHIANIKLLEHLPDEIAEIKIEPGREIVVTDRTATGRGHRLFRKDGEVIPDAIINDLTNLEEAICHRRVSVKRLNSISKRIEQRRQRDEEKQQLLEKINGVRQRRFDTDRFAVVNHEMLKAHPELLSESYARLEREEVELQAELDALTALPRRYSIARTALNLVTRH